MPAYYANLVGHFQQTAPESIVQTLTDAYASDRYKDLYTKQIGAWKDQVRALKSAFADPCLTDFRPDSWGIALEFVVPRKMGRIDCVLLVGSVLLVLEFKTDNWDSAADQVEDYCLDLINFHHPSHGRIAYPAVVANTGVEPWTRQAQIFSELMPTTFVDSNQLANWLSTVAAKHVTETQLSVVSWNLGDYRPVPTIVEAAIGMFAEMQVEDIARAGCDPINLTATVATIRRLVEESEETKKKKTVCFVTGVPGAGKTLAGLQIVHDREIREATGSECVFLTGNLPLVRVLQAALSRDAAERKKLKLRVARRDPKTTINTVLGYKKEYARNNVAPAENVVVFDEAQRAWDAKRTGEYLTADAGEYKGYSEPALLLSILDRLPWAALIALVGGGQEINRGEAGLPEWGRALADRFRHWSIVVSPQALSGEYGAGAKLFEDRSKEGLEIRTESDLHLDNPTRQFRGRTIANWTEALLRGSAPECQEILRENPDYPICITRDFAVAKAWLRSKAHGTERYGCIASSEARRLRAEGLELPPARADGVEHWFLETKDDIRSSFQLEVAANEFQIQGLEIDWACVCWGGDFLRSGNRWNLKRLRGTVWQEVGQETARVYLVNSYRVLLTRARQGMVLFVPNGDDTDLTRSRGPLDATAQFLASCGAVSL